MKEENRRYIAIISFLRKFITIFFSLFFNIYVLKIVNNDLNFILEYTVFSVLVEIVACYILLKFINSNNAKIIYKSSFPLLILTIFLLIIFKEKIVNYILIFKALERITEMCYGVPYELAIIGSNNNKTMSSFVANLKILSAIAVILTPIFSGFIIQEFSYYMLFIILAIEGLVIVAVSFKIKDFTINDKKLELKKFFQLTKNKQHIKDIYKCMFYRKLSAQGAIVELLPIILFLQLGKELDFGIYNSAFAVISIASLQILKIINSKKMRKNFYPYLAIIIFASSLLVIYNASFGTLMIYYILMYSLGEIIESESCSIVYAAIRTDGLIEYKKEHVLMYNIYMTVGRIISYSLVYVLYNFFYNINILSIAVSILMFFLVISTVYLSKTEKYLEEYEE